MNFVFQAKSYVEMPEKYEPNESMYPDPVGRRRVCGIIRRATVTTREVV